MGKIPGKHCGHGQIPCRGILHIVKDGDTLYKIAKKYGVPLARVMYANPYINVYNLQRGDEICVPVMGPRPLSETESFGGMNPSGPSAPKGYSENMPKLPPEQVRLKDRQQPEDGYTMEPDRMRHPEDGRTMEPDRMHHPEDGRTMEPDRMHHPEDGRTMEPDRMHHPEDGRTMEPDRMRYRYEEERPDAGRYAQREFLYPDRKPSGISRRKTPAEESFLQNEEPVPEQEANYMDRMTPAQGNDYTDRMTPAQGNDYTDRMIPAQGNDYADRMTPAQGNSFSENGNLMQRNHFMGRVNPVQENSFNPVLGGMNLIPEDSFTGDVNPVQEHPVPVDMDSIQEDDFGDRRNPEQEQAISGGRNPEQEQAISGGRNPEQEHGISDSFSVSADYMQEEMCGDHLMENGSGQQCMQMSVVQENDRKNMPWAAQQVSGKMMQEYRMGMHGCRARQREL